MTTPTDGQVAQAQAALARNDRYILEFVEALNLCPYAKRCRETGKLHRQVVFGRLDEALAAAAAVEGLPADSVEVALLILPGFTGGARAFDDLCHGVRDALRDFFCVAFHPELPEDLADEHRAVAFIRRTPDPTLQLVRASVLQAVRGTRTGGSTFVDTSKLTLAELMAVQSPLGVSEKIALANLAALRREGAASVRARLAAFRRR